MVVAITMRRAAFLAFSFLTAAGIVCAQVPGVPNFHKVDDRFYRGGQPTSEGFRNLAAAGVKTVIDLRNIGEHSQAREESWVESDGMRYISVPMRELSAPSNAQVARVLAILDDPSTGPVFVHCRRGSDRTGTVAACYRISHDHWKNRQALKEARGFGMSMFERGMQHYVLRYRESGAAASNSVATGPQQ